LEGKSIAHLVKLRQIGESCRNGKEKIGKITSPILGRDGGGEVFFSLYLKFAIGKVGKNKKRSGKVHPMPPPFDPN
jgi:hypothetical protein